MPISTTERTLAPRTALSRRHLFLAGVVGLSSLAALGSVAPARADDEVWSEEFMTRPETREGFLVDDLDEWQEENAKFVIAVCTGHGLDESAAKIVLITAIVESWLRNYEPAVDLDSGGLFQQRPSMGWGTYDEVRHKKLAIDAFLGLGDHSAAPGLLQVAPDYADWEPGAAAQAVQISAHPERYSEQLPAAQILWDRFADEVAPYTD
ncbi:hypothetical protein ACT3SP_13135 [Brachybacterium sp. AOP43-C2-M15]|uniref:hypothetical protein n=1 Tax=Brachybacterium sp. AOP43-C2-M15 TaxID=3457661 RepID=UPI0040334AE4